MYALHQLSSLLMDNPYDRTVKRLGQARGAVHWLIALIILGVLVSCSPSITDAVGIPIQKAVSDRPFTLLDDSECSGQNPDMDTVICAASWRAREVGQSDTDDARYYQAAGYYELVYYFPGEYDPGLTVLDDIAVRIAVWAAVRAAGDYRIRLLFPFILLLLLWRVSYLHGQIKKEISAMSRDTSRHSRRDDGI